MDKTSKCRSRDGLDDLDSRRADDRDTLADSWRGNDIALAASNEVVRPRMMGPRYLPRTGVRRPRSTVAHGLRDEVLVEVSLVVVRAEDPEGPLARS